MNQNKLFVVLVTVFTVGAAEKFSPPIIVSQFEDNYFYLDGLKNQFQEKVKCEAEGIPKPRISWWMLNNGNFEEVKHDGNTFKFEGNTATFYKEGVFRCQASNQFGIAISRNFKSIHERPLYIKPENLKQVDTKIGQYITIYCTYGVVRNKQLTQSPTIFSWKPSKVYTDKRFAIVENGDLHIIKVENDLISDTFVCDAKSSRIQSIGILGREFQLLIKGTESERQPSIRYSSKLGPGKYREVEVGKSVSLMCVPDGNINGEIPNIRWKRKVVKDDLWKDLEDGVSRVVLEQYDRKLIITQVEDIDMGEYVCYIEGRENINKSFNIRVFSKPRVDIKSATVYTGSNVVFKPVITSANSMYPETSRAWFKNGKELTAKDFTDHMEFSSEQLQFFNVRKPEDLSSLGIRSRNGKGDTYIPFTLNVLQKARFVINKVEITPDGEETTVTNMSGIFSVKPKTYVAIEVSVIADPLLVINKYVWLHGDQIITETNTTAPVYKEIGDKKLHIRFDSDIETLVGRYTCRFEVDDFVRDGSISSSITFQYSPDPEGVKAANFPFWAIGLAIGIVLLILIIVLIIFVIYRNRGAIWKVDEQERKAGNDIEKELAESGFHNLGRVDADEDDKTNFSEKMEKISWADNDPPPLYETSSLDEYGEPDPTKFNEEGSFINAYVDKDSTPQAPPYSQQSQPSYANQHPYGYSNQHPSSYGQPTVPYRSPRGNEHPYAYTNESLV